MERIPDLSHVMDDNLPPLAGIDAGAVFFLGRSKTSKKAVFQNGKTQKNAGD